jgi:hypothetical protein
LESLQVTPDLFQADSGLFPTRLAAEEQLVGIDVVKQVLIVAQPGYQHVELGSQPLNLTWAVGGQMPGLSTLWLIGP